MHLTQLQTEDPKFEALGGCGRGEVGTAVSCSDRGRQFPEKNHIDSFCFYEPRSILPASTWLVDRQSMGLTRTGSQQR